MSYAHAILLHSISIFRSFLSVHIADKIMIAAKGSEVEEASQTCQKYLFHLISRTNLGLPCQRHPAQHQVRQERCSQSCTGGENTRGDICNEEILFPAGTATSSAYRWLGSIGSLSNILHNQYRQSPGQGLCETLSNRSNRSTLHSFPRYQSMRILQ